MNETMIDWCALILAGLFEVLWAFFLKNSKGFTLLLPSILFIFTLCLSMSLLAYSFRSIPMGTAYPIWTGIGAVGTVIIGILFFKESLSLQKTIFLTLILVGVIGLKITSKE